MKIVKAEKLKSSATFPSMAEVSARLDTLGRGHKIAILNWEKYRYKPDVRFNIAYGDREIYLKYYVRETAVKAEKRDNNEMVCEDSCVEFFVSPADDGMYYNIEINPIGTVLVGAGHGRDDSIRAGHKHIDAIRRLTTMGSEPFTEIKGSIQWCLTLAIPLETFFHHHIDSLRGKRFRANFYKCGDKLSTPHYVTWNPVKTEKPDYHRPEYFGILKFV